MSSTTPAMPARPSTRMMAKFPIPPPCARRSACAGLMCRPRVLAWNSGVIIADSVPGAKKEGRRDRGTERLRVPPSVPLSLRLSFSPSLYQPSLNPPAPQHSLAVVQHDRLAGRDAVAGLVERDAQPAGGQQFRGRGCGRAVVADLGGAA